MGQHQGGQHKVEDDVTSALTLPQCMGTSARSVWSKITWESSDPSVIAIESTGHNSMVDPKSGKITPAENDTTVTLTATFNANDSALNTYVEKVSDFATFTKTFQVTVKGTGPVKPSEEELQAIAGQVLHRCKTCRISTQKKPLTRQM